MTQTYTYTPTGIEQVNLITWAIDDWRHFLEATPPEKRPVGLAPENFTWDGSTLNVNQAWEIEFNEALYNWLTYLCKVCDVSGIPDYPPFEENIPHKYVIVMDAMRLISTIKGTCIYDPPLPQF